MLKSPGKTYQSNIFVETKNTRTMNGSYSPSLQTKLPMSDSDAKQYIHLIFDKSPKSYSGTAPAHEWLQFLDRFNERQNYYILTELQKRAIKPYCDMNQDLEMTPDEFISLVLLIRHNDNQPQQQQETRHPFESRPRSNLLLNTSKSTMSYFDDRNSTNHPDSSHDGRPSRNTDYSNNNNNNEQDSTALLKSLKREKNQATKQLRNQESLIADLSREHSERLSQLETRLVNMKAEADQQKALVAEYKNKERQRLDKIAELKSVVDEYDTNHAADLKKLQKKNEELEKLREKLISMEEAHTITLTKAETELNQLKRAQEKEKADYHTKLDQEKRLVVELKHELEQQRNENIKLMELIDRQKFDLDEARSGLRYYANTPPIPMNNKKGLDHQDMEEQNLAQEQLQADYVRKIKDYEEKLAQTQEKLAKAEQDVVTSTQIQDQQKIRIKALSNQFDKQHALIDSIRLGLDHRHPRYIQKALSWIAYAFTLYHIILLIIGFIMHQRNVPHHMLVISYLHHLQDYFYSHLNRPTF